MSWLSDLFNGTRERTRMIGEFPALQRYRAGLFDLWADAMNAYEAGHPWALANLAEIDALGRHVWELQQHEDVMLSELREAVARARAAGVLTDEMLPRNAGLGEPITIGLAALAIVLVAFVASNFFSAYAGFKRGQDDPVARATAARIAQGLSIPVDPNRPSDWSGNLSSGLVMLGLIVGGFLFLGGRRR